ncbi:hypothetical protein Naga_100775g3 [Nannochloropsis gaditana]|uniref:Uncharacterized protein n=1 Tax=Nannochloropsis gaditana TaxID=72520 RepID=W7TLU9_9STRA|nr:hypothetical protein Naga_100775g3 [Nannochloropsis gaditana]
MHAASLPRPSLTWERERKLDLQLQLCGVAGHAGAQTLNLHGNRLSPFGASQLFTSLVKHRVMPALRRLDVRNTHVGADGLGSVLKILSLRAPSPSSSSSFPATTPNSPPLGTLRHLYVSLMHGKDEERQLETVQALLLQASQSLPRLRMLAILDEGEILDADTENRLKVTNSAILVRHHTRALPTPAV